MPGSPASTTSSMVPDGPRGRSCRRRALRHPCRARARPRRVGRRRFPSGRPRRARCRRAGRAGPAPARARARRRHPARRSSPRRGDQYRADVDADDVAHLWRCGSLLARRRRRRRRQRRAVRGSRIRGAPSLRHGTGGRRRASCSAPASGSQPAAPSTSSSPRSTTPPAHHVASPSARPPTCASSPSRSTSPWPTRGRGTRPPATRCDPVLSFTSGRSGRIGRTVQFSRAVRRR